MGIFYAQETWWNNRSAKQKEIIQETLEEVRIGEPAKFDFAGKRWVVWGDERLGLKQTARVGRDLKDIANRSRIVKRVPLTQIVQVTVPERVEVDVPVLDENGDPTGDIVKVWQDHPTRTVQIDVEEPLGDPHDLVMKAQGGPAGFKARSSLPDGAIPVDIGGP